MSQANAQPIKLDPIYKLISSNPIICGANISSKKKVLELAAETIAANIASNPDIELFDGFIARERLGSTAIGNHVALPHCKSKEVLEPACCLITLDSQIDYQADDNLPIKIIMALVFPEESLAKSDSAQQNYLDLLAGLAKKFRDPQFRSALINAKDRQQILDVLSRS